LIIIPLLQELKNTDQKKKAQTVLKKTKKGLIALWGTSRGKWDQKGNNLAVKREMPSGAMA